MRRQAPLAYDTRIAFPQDVVPAQQVQVDVFAKIGTDTIVIDPRTELYDLNIGGDSEGFSGLALRVRPQAEGATPGLRRRLEDAQATEDYIEQHDLRHFAAQVAPQPGSSQQLRAPPRQLLGAPSDSDPGDTASVTTEERLQKARQDAAEYVERFDLRQVLQNMFQRVIRERPEDPFGFMQAFLSSGSVRPWAVASVEADAAAEELRYRREQEQGEKLAASQKLLEEAHARIRELETGGAAGGPGSGEALARERAETAAQVEEHVKHIKALEQQLREAEAKNAAFPVALEQAKRREEEHQHQMTLTKAQVSAQSQRVETLEQQLKDARRAAASVQEDARKHGDSPSADSDAAAAAVHEAAAARDAAVARELAAAAAAVQEASVSRDAAVKRELATLQERTDLQRRCGDHEHNVKALEKKLQLLEKKSGMSVTDREAGVEPRTPAGSGQAPAASELAGVAEKLEAERRAHQDTQEKCREAERRLEEAKQRCGELERSHSEATERYAELQRSQQQAEDEQQSADRRSAEEKRFAEAVRQYSELEERHAVLERRCEEAELQRSELQKQVEDMQCQMQEAEDAAAAAAVLEGVLPGLPETGKGEGGLPEAGAEPGGGEARELKQLPPGPEEEAGPPEAAVAEPEQRVLKQTPPEDGGDTAQEVRILSERVEVERRCHEQALLECRELQRKKQTVERQKTELEARLASAEAASQASRDNQSETCKMLERRVQELEASVAAAASTASAQQTELSRSYEMQLENQNTRIEVLQRRIQAYEAFGVAGGDGAAGVTSQASPRGDAAAGGSRGSAKKVGLEGTGPQRAAATASTMPPPTASSMSLPAHAAAFGASGSGEVNTHMLSHLLASSYAPPVPPTTYLEPREDQEVEPGQPDPSLLVEVVDCKDVLSNGVFAWVGVCNLRPLYRLLGPEPRYLYYAEADIASNWRIVNKMGSEEYVERFRKPTDAKLPVECEKGDAGSGVFEVKLTVDVIQRISMIDSQDEKVAIRSRLAEAYGQQFVALEGRGRGLVSKASPVVAVAHALESQQRALQLLHGQLSVETQRREAAEQHSLTMQQAFETLQLRIQAQLPGPPSVASLQEVQAAISGQNARAFAEKPEAMSPPVSQDRGLVFEKDGKADWAPDLGPGCGPVPHPPIEPKDRKPVPPPTFRRGPVGLRNSKCSPRPVAYPVATGAPRPDDWSPDPLEPLPESQAETPVVAVE